MKQLLLFSAFSLVFFAGTLSAQTLPIDNNFGDAGISTLQVFTGYKVMNRIRVVEDDKIIAAGSSQGYNGGSTHFTVIKYLADGSLDNSFGNGGVVYTPVDDASAAQDFAVQPDGKIVVAGSSFRAAGQVMALVRYLPNGALDNTFGTNGRVTVQAGETSVAKSVALLPDGRILVAGYSGLAPYLDFTMVRLTADGALDPTFDNVGVVVSPMPTNLPTGEAVKVLLRPDGKFLVVGNYRSQTMATVAKVFIAQYQSDGQLDTSFADNGIWSVPPGQQQNWVDEAVLAPDGRIIAVGTRFNPVTGDYNLLSFAVKGDGTTDTAYGNNGFAVLQPDGRNGFTGTGLAIKNDGTIRIGGGASVLNNQNIDGVVLQLTPNGQYDLTFNQLGYGFYPLFGYFSTTLDIEMQSNGRILQLVQFVDSANNTAILGYADSSSVGTDETVQALLPKVAVFPNPANDRSMLEYRLTEASQVAVYLYDPSGRYIRQILAPQSQVAGTYTVSLALGDLPPGNYAVVVEAGSGRRSVGVAVVR